MKEKISLLILQPTPFCNINCSYCYLPNRNLTKRMSAETFTKILKRLDESDLVGEKLSLVWHAGEPLALPISYYHELFEIIESFPSLKEKIVHSLQTNGMLINDAWGKLFKQYEFSIGLSIDGPAFLHDSFRKDRLGQGTFARVLSGLECLRRNDVSFHVIAVLTSKSLDYADEIFQFFLDLGVRNVGFNIEEKEGVNSSSSLEGDFDERMKKFFQRMYELQTTSNGQLMIREFNQACRGIASADLTNLKGGEFGSNDQVNPFRILTVDSDGHFSTFSPELLGMNNAAFGDFIFGNVHENSFESIRNNQHFLKVLGDVRSGVEKCRSGCEYFALCGGGAPANKLYENGTFDSSETMYCRYTIKYPIDIALNDLESQLLC